MTVLALSTGSLYTYGIARVFELAAETGFDAVEILVDHRWDSRQATYLRRLSGESGLPIVAVHSPFKPIVPGWPHESVGRLRETVALAGDVGAGVVVAHLPLRIRGARIEFFGFRRSIDIHWLNSLEALAGMPHVTLDTTHLGTWGLDVVEVYEKLASHVVHVHLSNYDGREHRLPGDGRLRLKELLRRLNRDGYEGAVSLEVGPDVLQAEQESQVRAHLRQAVAFLRS